MYMKGNTLVPFCFELRKAKIYNCSCNVCFFYLKNQTLKSYSEQFFNPSTFSGNIMCLLRLMQSGPCQV